VDGLAGAVDLHGVDNRSHDGSSPSAWVNM
jgi:hypothetical protein